MVAVIRQYQPTVTTKASPLVPAKAAQTAAGDLGQGLTAMGEAGWRVEEHMATAHAYQVDAEFTDFLRETMSGDGSGNGYLNSKLGSAVNGHEGVMTQVKERYGELVESLNPLVKSATVRSMEARYQTFLRQANSHRETQARAAVAAAGAARVNANRNAAIRAGILGDAEGFKQAEAAIKATAEELYPNDPVKRETYVQTNMSDAHRAVAQGIAEESGAEAAWVYVEANQNEFDVGDLWGSAEAYRGAALDARGGAAADIVTAQAIETDRKNRVAAAEYASEQRRTGQQHPSVFNQDADGNPLPPSPTASGHIDVEQPIGAPRSVELPVVGGNAHLSTFTMEGLKASGITPEAYGTAGTLPSTGTMVPPLLIGGDPVILPPKLPAPDWSEARAELEKIENPRARAAAIQKLEENKEAWIEAQDQTHDKALEAAQNFIRESGGTPGVVDQIPAEVTMYLTPNEREGLYGFARTIRQNRDPVTDISVAYLLEYSYGAKDVKELARVLLSNKGQMSAADVTKWSARLAALQTGEVVSIDDVSWSQVNTEIGRAMANHKMTVKDNPGTRRMLDVTMRDWVRTQVENNHIPTQDEIAQHLDALMLVEVRVDGHRGLGTEYTGSALGIPMDDFDNERLDKAARRGQLNINGVSVSEQDLASVKAAMEAQLGYEPPFEYLWRGLIAATMGGGQ